MCVSATPPAELPCFVCCAATTCKLNRLHPVSSCCVLLCAAVLCRLAAALCMYVCMYVPYVCLVVMMVVLIITQPPDQGIPDFWLTAMANHDMIGEYVTERDAEVRQGVRV